MIFLLERTVRIGLLFDFYGALLTERQQEMIKLYYYHDLSLGEIADEYKISRQAVYDNLKRSEDSLEEYEEQLNLVQKHKERQVKIEDLKKVVEKIADQIPEGDLQVLKKITGDLSD